MNDDEQSTLSLARYEAMTALSELLAMPLEIKGRIEVSIDRAKAEARVKIIEADILIKYDLL